MKDQEFIEKVLKIDGIGGYPDDIAVALHEVVSAHRKAGAAYQRPELTDADKATAERDSKALVKKYGYNNLPKILAALAVENVRLVKEINEHRAARGIDPLPTFEV